ncbi:MAG: hypothetical protein LBV74_01250 [Tannerella sp.]|nr:hypothetical protein [Tannerella sp.]
MDYSQYRINSVRELDSYLKGETREWFLDRLNKVYGLLMNMKPLDLLSIEKNVSPENREIFVKLACQFIAEGNSDYEFTPDWQAVRRLKEKPEESIRRSNKIREEKRANKLAKKGKRLV